MVWWAWSAYAWLTDAIDVENIVTRLLVLAAMAAGFFMALAVPDAFQDEAAWFAVAYFVVRILQSALFSWGVRDHPGHLRATIRLAPWFVGAASARTRRRIRGQRPSRVGLARVARARRRRRAGGGTGRVAHLAVALRRALRADRDHRARGVDRGDRDRNLGARARLDVCALRARCIRRGRGAVVGVLRLRRNRGRAIAETGRGASTRDPRSRRLHLLPLPDRARDHLLCGGRQEDARAPARSAVDRRSLGARARGRGLPPRLRAHALPRGPLGSPGSGWLPAPLPSSWRCSSTGRTRS